MSHNRLFSIGEEFAGCWVIREEEEGRASDADSQDSLQDKEPGTRRLVSSRGASRWATHHRQPSSPAMPSILSIR